MRFRRERESRRTPGENPQNIRGGGQGSGMGDDSAGSIGREINCLIQHLTSESIPICLPRPGHAHRANGRGRCTLPGTPMLDNPGKKSATALLMKLKYE